MESLFVVGIIELFVEFLGEIVRGISQLDVASESSDIFRSIVSLDAFPSGFGPPSKEG